MIPLNYQELYTEKSFIELMRVFGEWSSPSEIKLNAHAGKGFIQILDVEEGLQIRIWDCTLKTEVLINRMAVDPSQEYSFTLLYYITPGFVLENCPGLPGKIDKGLNNIFIPSNAEFKIKMLANKPLQCMSLNFTAAWLEKNIFGGTDFGTHFFKKHVKSSLPFVILESITHNEEMLVRNLFQNRYHHSFGRFFFRSKALNLLTEFFLKIEGRKTVLWGDSLFRNVGC